MGRGHGQDCDTRVSRRPPSADPKPSAPGRLARAVAAQAWPDVQTQQRIDRGVYGFVCAGHGGIVAVIGEADLPEEMIEAARRLGKTELVLEDHAGGRIKRWTTPRYRAEDMRRKAGQHPDRLTLSEVWVGEEDCDWATILYANPDLIQKSIDAGYDGPGLDLAGVKGSLERWNEAFLAELDPDYVPIPGGQLETLRRHQELLDSGAFLRQSATRTPDGRTEVSFRDKDGEERGYLMDEAVYGEIPLGVDATPEDYRRFGEITLVA